MDREYVKLESKNNCVPNILVDEIKSEYLNIISPKSEYSEVQNCCTNSLEEEMTVFEDRPTDNGESDNFTARIRAGHKIWVCRFCNRVYRRLESFKQHVNTHSKHQVFQCDFCSNKYLLKDSLRTHIRRSHKIILSSYVCSVCNQNCNNESELQMHRCSKSLHCEFCSNIYFSKQNLLKHLQEAHKENLEGGQKKELCNEKFTDEMELEHLREKLYTCIICQKHFLNEREFEVHMTEHYDKMGPFRCELCSNSYTIRDSLRTHIRRHHKSDTTIKKEKNDDLYCDVCGETFYREDDLKRHKNENIYKCNICQKHWSNVRTFKYHMNKHSNEQQVYRCEFCDKSYMILDSLKIHIRRHHRDVARKQDESKRKPKAHKCNICNAYFSKNVRLREHMSSHSKLMLMECQVCGAEFGSRDELRRHIQETHRCAGSEKLYTCTMCKKQFERYFLLGQHMQQHRGGKPHRCEECARQFSSCVHLEVHKKRRHDGVKPYSCDMCGQAFFRRKFMMLHMCKQPTESDPLS